MSSNQNKNKPNIPEEKLKEKGILKILNVIIPEEGEDLYNCIMEDGTIKIISASDIIEE